MARRKTTRLAFDALMVEGALIAPDMIADVAALKATAQSEAAYRIPPGLKLRDEIGRAWRIAEALWARFSQARAVGPLYAATQAFVDDLLRQVFGFTSLEAVVSRQVGTRAFPVRRVALGGRIPIAIAPAGEGLDRGLDQFAEERRKRSASLFIQEVLNADDAARWGIATDGLRLRLLRDNASLTRPAYIEVDLERIFESGLYADFVALWLLIHESRFGAVDAAPSDCPLERWRDAGREAGAKARDRLGLGVEEALKELGTGFIEHLANSSMRETIQSGTLTPQALYEELLRLVYRLIFLFTTEDRGLLHDPKAGEAAKVLYAEGYSLARLRTLAARRAARDLNHDLYEGLKVVFRALWRGEEALGLPALGGLFRGSALPNLADAKITNKRLLEAVFRLAWIVEDRTLMRVNWRDMETEELGSVYEALLELTPRADLEKRQFLFAEGAEIKGNARKTSGSYYTPDSLVQLLLNRALDPVIDRAVNENPGRAAEALLDLTVLDPACGSGHFLLAAGRRLATRLVQLRSLGAPSAEDWRHALCEVARHCLFGVDRNPMAVELCQTALWIESVEPGKPLTFLDAHVLCGDSLIGVWDLKALKKGVPDDAYKPLTGDNKTIANVAKKLNKAQREQPRQRDLFVGGPADLSSRARGLEDLPEDELQQVEAKAKAFAAFRNGDTWWSTKVACDLYIAAFFRPKVKREGALGGSHAADDVPTTTDVWAALEGHPPQGRLTARAIDAAEGVRAFHWPLAFPHALAKGGFDCVVGNPPWERIKLQEEEFFANRHPLIASAKNKAERSQRIDWLAEGMLVAQLHPELNHTEAEDEAEKELYAEFSDSRRRAEATSLFAHLKADDNGRYPLTGVGDVNTYALFAETIAHTVANAGRAGFIVPTGIATDDSTKAFFSDIAESGKLIALLSFENEEFIFPAVHHSSRFCLLVLGGPDRDRIADFVFFARQTEQVQDNRRRFTLSPADYGLLNPNTRTCPIFRSRKDAELTKEIYARVPVLVRERQDDHPEMNAWGVRLSMMFHMANDSHLFHSQAGVGLLPLYEGKMCDFYDHRAASYELRGDTRGFRVLPATTLEQHRDPHYQVAPFYWVKKDEALRRLPEDWTFKWLPVFKKVTATTNERTFLTSLLPLCGVGDSMNLVLPASLLGTRVIAALVGNFAALVLDYVARQKIGGVNTNYFHVRQLPVLSPDAYSEADLDFIVPRVLELTYTADDLRPWAVDIGYEGPPFPFDPKRRAFLRSELDALYAQLYGLSREDLCYILDPASVMGSDYPSETFRVLKNSEEREFGEYLTQRLVLAAWDRLERGVVKSGMSCSRT